MASSQEFLNYVCDSISEAGEITTKRMFGEYGIYCNGIYFGCVCDNMFFIKITENGKEYAANQELGSPYKGAKECFMISNLDDVEYVTNLVKITCESLSKTKKK